MSQALHAVSRGQRTPDPRIAGAMAKTAAAAEIAARGAIGSMSAQALCAAVRDHPVLSLVLASGIGYLFGCGQRSHRERSQLPEAVER